MCQAALDPLVPTVISHPDGCLCLVCEIGADAEHVLETLGRIDEEYLAELRPYTLADLETEQDKIPAPF
jgi:hypothetical protein